MAGLTGDNDGPEGGLLSGLAGGWRGSGLPEGRRDRAVGCSVPNAWLHGRLPSSGAAGRRVPCALPARGEPKLLQVGERQLSESCDISSSCLVVVRRRSRAGRGLRLCQNATLDNEQSLDGER
jgi:hypothetical protein